MKVVNPSQTAAAMVIDDAMIISPIGAIPAGLWPELAAIVLLEPQPELREAWIKRLENQLCVRAVHRAFVAGGVQAMRELIYEDRMARGLLVDDFSRVKEIEFFPGEAPKGEGHMLAEPDPDRRGLRLNAIRPGDERLAWYVFRAATRQERRAEANLIRAGYTVYVPRLTYWRRCSHRRVRAELSLFAGYIFVGVGANQSIGQAVDLDAVHNVVRFEGLPRQVSFAPIARLVEQEVAGEFDRTRRDRRKDPEPGAPVKILSGMFAGWPAAFVERREDERIAVLLKMMGRETPYTVDAEDVELPAAAETLKAGD